MLVDLPGFQRPMDKLTERMQRTVDTSFEDIDVVLFVLSARDRIGGGDRFIARRVFALGKPVIIALNKVDNLKPGHIISQMKAAARSATSTRCIRSARRRRTGSTSCAATSSTCCPRASRSSSASRRPTRPSAERITELIREKALQLTRDEVPHSISVELDELDDKLLRAFVLVETESQKQILVGKKGAMIREIGVARPAGDRARCSAARSSSSSSSRCARSGAATTPRSNGSGSSRDPKMGQTPHDAEPLRI